MNKPQTKGTARGEGKRAGFTPGPWVIDLDGEDSLAGYIGIRSSGNVIAQVESWDDSGQSGKLEAEANARLIAAAPELLEALKVLTRRYTFQEQDSEQVKAAIAHAEGRDA